ncbi:MAG: TolC family protein [Bacteroides sp.]|nr:TolC family protein [Bacteroides sp.]MCM1085927.1 TolC family protein [Bacteroides sp.]
MKRRTLILGLMMAGLLPLSPFSRAQEQRSDQAVLEEAALEEPQHLSLEEAVDFALEHNKSLQASRLDIDLYKKKVMEAVSAGIPQINGSLGYSSYFGYEMNFMGAGSNTIDPELLQKYSEHFEAISLAMGDMSGGRKMKDNLGLNVSAQWTFSGQWVVGIQTAKIARTLASQQTDITALDIKSTVYNSYYTILVCEHLLEILNDNLKNMQEILQHTQNMYDAGSLEISDVDQLRITVGQLNNSKLAMERTVDVNYNLLRIQLGVKAGTPLVLTEPLDRFLNVELFAEWAFKNLDVNENLSYQATLTQEKMQKKSLTSAYLACVPTLSAGYNYQYQIIEGGFMNMPHSATVTLNVPIFGGLSRTSKINQAKISLQQTRLNKSLLEDQLHLQEAQYKYNLQNATENFKLQKDNMEVAKSVLGHYQAKFEVGAISSLDLTQANNNYLGAANNYTSACLDLLQAQTELLKLYNELP